MKVHCARMSKAFAGRGHNGLRDHNPCSIWFVGGDDRFAVSLCGVAFVSETAIYAHLKSGGDITHPGVFCWLPKGAQCGRCRVLFDPFRSYSMFARTPYGQRHAPDTDEHYISIEVALLAIAKVWTA